MAEVRKCHFRFAVKFQNFGAGHHCGGGQNPREKFRHILNWLLGITNQQWQKAIEIVVDIAIRTAAGKAKAPEKILMFENLIKPYRGDMENWAINNLRENAYAYAKKQKLIP